MLEHYLATLFKLGQPRDLAHSALPDAPVQPHPNRGKTDPNHHSHHPTAPTDTPQAAAPADPPATPTPNRPSQQDPYPCPQAGLARSNRHSREARRKQPFPQLDQQPDTWQTEHGRLYR